MMRSRSERCAACNKTESQEPNQPRTTERTMKGVVTRGQCTTNYLRRSDHNSAVAAGRVYHISGGVLNSAGFTTP
ncbi:hypothetical protein J6590_029428 [Homalodisca vitripennis]|nr:hypothetical protein J6590_029428 [Homalodisca vitripennis]